MKILCGQCGQMSLVSAKAGAKAIACSHCGHKIDTSVSSKPIRPVFDVEPEDQAFAVASREALARKVHVNCGACGRGLKVSLRMAGRKTTCPACGERVKLPLAGHEADMRLEALIEKRSAAFFAAQAEAAAEETSASIMNFDESELAELATYVDSDSSKDDIAIEISDEDDEMMHRSAEAMEDRDILALRAAVSAISHRPASSPDELPALQKAAKQHKTVTKRSMSGQNKLLITIAAVLCISAGIWMTVKFIFNDAPPADPNSIAGFDPGKTDLTPNTGSNTPATKPVTTKPIIDKPIPPVTPKIIAACRAVTSVTDSFASGGFFPAKPGKVYCRITVQVKAGDDKVEFSNYGESAKLQIGLNSFTSIGEPVKTIFPTLPQRKHFIIPSKTSKTLTMLFDLPEKALGKTGARGVVTLGKLPPMSIQLGSPAHVLPAAAVTDKSKPYLEIAPRNTRPMLSDPVMAAIQRTTPQKLSIRKGPADGSVKLSLGSGEITGAATRDSRGLYVAQLKHNKNTLDCLLRFSHGGREAILYMSEEPFHQLTFAQTGWSKSLPIVPQITDTVKPKPKPPVYKPKPKPPTNGGGARKPGFFGV
ncbi:MAG: hypothetical protein HN350_15890 [Phycisphaerales bacterium]|nr:hypothetical protein [Phycisphaerales bacterium]